MNNEIPDPSPYPFESSSSRSITRIPAKTSWNIKNMQLVTPIKFTSPYIPLNT